MKKILILATLFILLAIPALASAGTEIEFTQESKDEKDFLAGAAPKFNIQQIRQDPFPANPGELVEIYLRLENNGGEIWSPSFIMNLEHPFKLDLSSPSTKDYISLEAGERITLKYKIKVDASAAPDDYEVNFHIQAPNQFSYDYFFNLEVDDVTSKFDVAIDEISEEGVSVALSNTGKNTANSITVRIPEQESFEVLGLPSNIIGNLNSGDYTILTTQIAPRAEGETLTLFMEIDYTDTIGNRRTETREVAIPMTTQTVKGFNALENYIETGRKASDEGEGTSGWFYVTVIIIVAWGIFYWKHRKKHKRK
jgi:hypothetical protein